MKATVIGAAIAATAAAAFLTACGAVDEQVAGTPPTPTATTDPDTSAPEATAASTHPVDLANGTWSTLPQAPMHPRVEAAAVDWTGRYLIVWGGSTGYQGPVLGDGAVYDSRTGRWRTMASSPLAPRTAAASIWTGSRMIVWGGRGGPQAAAAPDLADGAAYDPVSNTWTTLPPAPLTARQGALAVWTGSRMLVLGGYPAAPTDAVESLTDGATYDPATGTWQTIAAPDDPPGHHIEWTTAVMTDHDVLAWGDWQVNAGGSITGGDDLFHLAPQSGRWTFVQPAKDQIPDARHALWTGTTLYVRGINYNCGVCPGPPSPTVTAVYRPDTNTWTRLPPDPLGTMTQLSAPAGNDLLSYNPTTSISGPDTAAVRPGDTSAYDPRANTWTPLPSAPFGCEDATQSPAFLDDAIAYWCPPTAQGPGAGHDGLLFTAPN